MNITLAPAFVTCTSPRMAACHPRCSRSSRPGNVCTPPSLNYSAACQIIAISMHTPCSLLRCAQCMPLDNRHMYGTFRRRNSSEMPAAQINAPSARSACLACTLRSYHTESPTIHPDSALVGLSKWANFPLTVVIMSSANYGLSNISEKERDTVTPSASWTKNSRWGSGQVHGCFSPSVVMPNYWRS
ncbi:uncharacterized protein BO80DRAFT_256040 [Aspergillus ibericus CBS 121593]|uniref:Uncharacterized protein n=1 Tax=Aspergillus ibericus CBS 121593 TaxID=1448316 RepID=A0A395H833_9EURO|nr:hypothetical protein BO80DRAFT_256040 [Aspergillus ibericus CBS 121593]RAL04101.1 hypothetical protein BO80DRAFT_256040 [Aspergillus ibericus CBS 121593]